MASNLVRCSIVIPTVNNSKGVFDLLTSIDQIEDADQFQIMIIQNPPAKTFHHWQNQFQRLKIEHLSCARGVNQARNTGLAHAKGELIFFFDDDCTISDRELFKKHQLVHSQRPEIFAIGGRYQNLSSAPIDRAYDFIQEQWLKINSISIPGECQVLLGGHFSIKRINKSMPQFDSQIIYGGSETEYFWRLNRLGFRFYILDCYVQHNPDLNIKALAKKAHKQGKTHRRLLQSGHSFKPYWLYDPASFNPYVSLYFFFFDPSVWIETKAKTAFFKVKNRLYELRRKIYFYVNHRELF